MKVLFYNYIVILVAIYVLKSLLIQSGLSLANAQCLSQFNKGKESFDLGIEYFGKSKDLINISNLFPDTTNIPKFRNSLLYYRYAISSLENSLEYFGGPANDSTCEKAALAKNFIKVGKQTIIIVKDSLVRLQERLIILLDTTNSILDSILQSEKIAKNLSLAQSLASKSLQIQDPLLQSIVAYHAYHLHTQYKGRAYDKTIYEALYASLKLLPRLREPDRYNPDPSFNQFHFHKGLISQILLSPLKDRIYSLASDGSVIEWAVEISTQEIIEKNRKKVFSNVAHLYEISPDGQVLTLYKKNENKAYYWPLDESQDSYPFVDVEKCNLLKRIPQLPNNYLAHYSDSLHYFFLFSKKENSLRIGTYVNDLAFSSEGSQIAIAGENGILWRGDPLEDPLKETLATGEVFNSVTFGKVSAILAAGHQNGELWLWNFEEGKRGEITTPHRIKLPGHTARVSSVQFACSDSLLISASYDGTIHIWDLSLKPVENQLPIVLDDHDGEFITALAIDPAKKLIYSGTNDGRIRLWFMDFHDLAVHLKHRLRKDYGPGSPREYTHLEKEMLKYTIHLNSRDSQDQLFPWRKPVN